MRGHGQTDKPQGRVRVAHLASDVVDLLDALGAERAHVVGLSLGGCVAQQREFLSHQCGGQYGCQSAWVGVDIAV